MTFFALLQQTHIFWTGNNIQRNDERQLRGSSSSADFFLTSQVPAKEELGRAGWTILHRIAAKFSEEPEELEKKKYETIFDFICEAVSVSRLRKALPTIS